MQFRQGTSVYTAGGEDIGHVVRVVLDPRTKTVSHIVVEKGFLFTEDKVVPIDLIAAADEDRVTLRPDAGDLDKLPAFEETHYIPLTDEELRTSAYPTGYAAPYYAYPPMSGWMGYTMSTPAYYPPRVVDTDQNIPEGSIALREGARVMSADDEHVGNVERVFTGSQSDQATGFVISQGLIFKERKFVPIEWVREIGEDEVRLSVGADLLNDLRAYEDER